MTQLDPAVPAPTKTIPDEEAAAATASASAAASPRRRTLLIAGSIALVVLAALAFGLGFGLTRSTGSVSSSSIVSDNYRNCFNGTYDPNVDYFPKKLNLYVPNPNFQVKYFNNYKVIVNSLNPAKIETLVLYQCGTPKPTLSNITVTRYISVPIKSIFVGDTTSIAYLELLGVRDTIKATDSLDYTTSPCLIAANASSVGPLNTDNTNSSIPIINKQDLALDYLDSVTALADNYVTFPATADLSPYNRIAWLGFLAAFYNLEDAANNIIKTIADNYNCVKNARNTQTTKPTVASVEFLAAQSYTMNTSVYVLNRWPVYVQYILDAGGMNITTPVADIDARANKTVADFIGSPYRSFFTDRAAFLDVIKNVDVLIDDTYFFSGPPNATSTLGSFGLTEANTEYKFIKNKAIWRTDKRTSVNGGLDWYETAVVLGNVVLADVVTLTNNLTTDTVYFRNVWKTDLVTVTADQCGASGAAALTQSGLGGVFGSGVKTVSC